MFPAFPAHAQPAILRIWQEAHSMLWVKHLELTNTPHSSHSWVSFGVSCEHFGEIGCIIKRPQFGISRIILFMNPTNERWYYIAMAYLIGWVQTQNVPCYAVLCTVWCSYNIVNFLQYPHKRHPIAHLLEWAIGCLFGIKTLIYILPQTL